MTKAHKNIRIENIRLDDDAYYRELAKHRFVLLPYREESYSNRSSGVVLESIFLGNIVIGPKFLLRQLEKLMQLKRIIRSCVKNMAMKMSVQLI